MASRRKPRQIAGKSKKQAKVSLPGAEDYLRQLRSMKGSKESASFSMYSEELVTNSVEEFVSSGSLGVDRLTGGGWPIGRIAECAAWESVGKSTLLDQSLAQVQRIGGIAALIDSEKARDEKYTSSLGVDIEKLLMAEAVTIEDGFEAIEKMVSVQESVVRELKKKHRKNTPLPPPMLIVWDSLGGTPTRAELEGEAGDSHVSVAARNIKLNMRRLTQKIARLRISLIFANQFYETIGGFGGKKSYGGGAIRYYPSVRLWLARTGTLTMGGDNRLMGHTVKAELKKTRIGKPRKPQELGLIYGAGFDNAYTLFEWGKGAGNETHPKWIVQSGPHYWVYPPGEEPIWFQSKYIGLGQLFAERPDVYSLMARQYLAEGKEEE